MNVLLINLARMGDLVQITPVSQGFVEELGARVTLLAPARYADFARRLAGVEEVCGIEDAFLPGNGTVDVAEIYSRPEMIQCLTALKSRSFDLVVNLTHDELSTALAMAVGGKSIRGRFGFPGQIQVRGDALRYFYAILENRVMNSLNLCDLYRFGAGIRRGGRPVRMIPLEQDRTAIRGLINAASGKPRVILHPGANHPHRRWPAERFGKLAQMLHADGTEVLILTGPGESSLGTEVQRASKGAAQIIPGPVPVELLPALLTEADLLITNDTGPLHIAASVGTPTVSLFLAMARPQDTAPYAPGQMILETTENCHPCPEYSECEAPVCGNSIPVEAVYSTSRARLNGSFPEPGEFAEHSGRYRVLVTRWDADGLLTYDVLYNSSHHRTDLDRSDLWKPFWISLFEGNRPDPASIDKIRETVDLEGQRALLAIATLTQGVLARLSGEVLKDADGNPLSIAALEDFALQEEKRSQSVKSILLPYRLEREALYARGVDIVRSEASSRFSRWIQTLIALSPDAVREEVAA